MGPVVVGIAHFLVALINIELTSWSTGLATVWVANAIVLAALLVVPASKWGYYAVCAWLAGFAANVLGAYPFPASAAFTSLNVVEALLVAFVVRRWTGSAPRLEHPADLVRFIVAALAAAALSASLSAPVMAAAVGEGIGASWLSWFASDALGMLIIAPMLLIVYDIWAGRRSVLQGRTVTEAAALGALVTLVSLGVFAQSRWPLLFLLLPPIVLVTFRLRSIGATVAVLIVAAIGSYYTTIGSGPIGLMAGDFADRIYFFQFFLAAAFLPALPVASVLDERDALAAIAERQAATDDLTGTASRRRFLSRLETELGASARSRQPLVVALIDVDHFKRINDSFGHDVGDEVLRKVAAAAMTRVGDGGLVGRLGGEEFALLLPGHHAETAARLCERLLADCAAICGPEGNVLGVTISIGIAEVEQAAVTGAALKAADTAMYAAKAAGRNRIVVTGRPPRAVAVS
jgi:diguanylate cyclase (GGDEF)-like protein